MLIIPKEVPVGIGLAVWRAVYNRATTVDWSDFDAFGRGNTLRAVRAVLAANGYADMITRELEGRGEQLAVVYN